MAFSPVHHFCIFFFKIDKPKYNIYSLQVAFNFSPVKQCRYLYGKLETLLRHILHFYQNTVWVVSPTLTFPSSLHIRINQRVLKKHMSRSQPRFNNSRFPGVRLGHHCVFFLINFYWCTVDLQCVSFRYSKVNQLYIYIYPLFFRFFFHVVHYGVLTSVPWAILLSRFSRVRLCATP